MKKHRELIRIKKLAQNVCVLFLLFGLLDTAHAINIQVIQGGVSLGFVTPFTGGLTGPENYNYSSGSGNPIVGPPTEANVGQIFFYDSFSDGLNFITIFDKLNSGSPGNHVAWNFTVTGSTTDPMVRFSDDANETQEIGPNLFESRWSYTNNTDGVVIGEIGGAAWEIFINPIEYRLLGGGTTTLHTLRVADNSGSFINLNLDTDCSCHIQFKPIPEPGTMMLLASGLIGLAGFHRTIKRQKRNRF